MIQVALDRKNFRLTMTGHAGHGKKGGDLVCAAASILAYTLAEDVRELEQQGAVRETTVQLEDGYAEICCTSVKQMRTITEMIFCSVWPTGGDSAGPASEREASVYQRYAENQQRLYKNGGSKRHAG